MSEDIYPMPSFPMLMVRDLEASTKFYMEALDFKHIFTMPGPGGKPGLVHLRWLKYADLLITLPRGGKEVPEPRGTGIALNYGLYEREDNDIDAFAARVRAYGAEVIGPIAQPWNVREVTVIDPDGYQLVFTMPINIHADFDQIVKKAAGS
jgi:catechol 2,3-dioxygenase-like lactoylglutathione lyase family enzyme